MDNGLFTNKREKRLWLLILIVVLGIYSSLAITPRLAERVSDQQAAVVFLFSMFLIAMMVLVQGLRRRRGGMEIGVVLGVVAVYSMVFLRLGLAERTHLIEYSVVAVLVLEALNERMRNHGKVLLPVLIAVAVTISIGVVDEIVQVFLPNRVFDVVDILFNSLAAIMAVIGMVFVRWARRRTAKGKEM